MTNTRNKLQFAFKEVLGMSDTRSKILEIEKKEFLKHGFKDASLRGIVKEAGFTQGAFYGYYKDKASFL